MRTETIKIEDQFGEEFKGTYVFKAISWAKRNRIIQKHTKYGRSGQVLRSDFVSIQAETIIASLKDQPKNNPLTLEKLLDEDKGVPVELGEVLSKIVNRLNGMSERGLRFLLMQLNERSLTELLHSLGYAKSSD